MKTKQELNLIIIENMVKARKQTSPHKLRGNDSIWIRTRR